MDKIETPRWDSKEYQDNGDGTLLSDSFGDELWVMGAFVVLIGAMLLFIKKLKSQ